MVSGYVGRNRFSASLAPPRENNVNGCCAQRRRGAENDVAAARPILAASTPDCSRQGKYRHGNNAIANDPATRMTKGDESRLESRSVLRGLRALRGERAGPGGLCKMCTVLALAPADSPSAFSPSTLGAAVEQTNGCTTSAAKGTPQPLKSFHRAQDRKAYRSSCRGGAVGRRAGFSGGRRSAGWRSFCRTRRRTSGVAYSRKAPLMGRSGALHPEGTYSGSFAMAPAKASGQMPDRRATCQAINRPKVSSDDGRHPCAIIT